MRRILLALAAVAALQAIDTKPSEARVWYPWCAQYADRSGATSCSFSSYQQCRASVSGIGGNCIQNWYPQPGAAPAAAKSRRQRYSAPY